MLEKCCKPQITTGISGVNSSLRALSILMSYSHFFFRISGTSALDKRKKKLCVCVQCYVAVYVSEEIKFQCLVKQGVLVVFLLVKVLLPKDENVCSVTNFA